ncbi:phospholipase D family protein [Mesoflavibacter profundi]|uniref:phospholipase D family protein n=1 Tax=Mesoflavibacter profundi TaxID=2708110 RepID=UPI00168A7361|nr:phospholipase D family protein [Mesoflavibacter profundi]
MSKFLTGKDLDDAICDIIWDTERTLLIVSPYIKLDDYFKKLFDKHENNPKIHLILVFGKNERAVKKSLSKADFDYFKKFLNVSIIYVPNLHAKYYGNEKKGVITSINLYDYSFINNIEFGVFREQSIMDNFTKSADKDAWDKCIDIAETNDVVFIKRPVFENKKMIINLGKSYVKSDILFDSTDKFYGYRRKRNEEDKRLSDFPDELELGSVFSERPARESEKRKQNDFGYCIRSGEKIKFNPKQPMSRNSWKIWNEYGNEDFPENYCHKTGKKSNGKTSMRKPIL